jgi:hypothetical protein
MLSGLASLVVGIACVVCWHFRRARMGWPRRKPDYVWAFLHGGIVYVMAALLVVHHYEKIPYSEALANGFGDTQVNVAFIGAMFEAAWALWDLWNGNDAEPSVGGG